MPEPRRREFRAGRTAARRAWRNGGHSTRAILREPNGAPVWPHGWVGSIAHTRGLALAVVASSSDCAGIGVDVETLGRISPRTWRGFLQETEQVWIDTQPEEKKALWASRFFAVKEAFYKLQYPQTGVWLGCLGATLILKDEAGGVSVFRLEITDDRHPWFKNIPKKVQLTAMEADGVVVALAI